MDRNEFTLKLAEIILNDWRKTMLANESTKGRFCLPGDATDAFWRAMQKASDAAGTFYVPVDTDEG